MDIGGGERGEREAGGLERLVHHDGEAQGGVAHGRDGELGVDRLDDEGGELAAVAGEVAAGAVVPPGLALGLAFWAGGHERLPSLFEVVEGDGGNHVAGC